MAELTINAADITAAIRKNLEGFTPDVALTKVGRVIEVGDGIARCRASPDAAVNELLEFENGTAGPGAQPRRGVDRRRGARRGRPHRRGPVGEVHRRTSSECPSATACSAGSSTPLGEPIDGKGPLANVQPSRRMEIQAPGITGRQPVGEPMQTGIKSIDSHDPRSAVASAS